MAQLECLDDQPSSSTTRFYKGPKRELDTYSKFLVAYNERVQMMHSRSINTEQCQYLADKLNVVTESSNMFLKTSPGGSYAPKELEKYLLSFNLLLVLATEVERFIKVCSQDAWVPIAMTLTNVSEFVSSIGFHLELCQVALSNKYGASGGLSLDQVANMSKDVNKIVKTKTSMDKEDLLKKISLALPSLHGDKKDLASYLFQRLMRVAPIPSIPSPKSKWDLPHYLDFLRSISKKVKEGEFIGKGASARVHKAMWLGMEVAIKVFNGKNNPNFKKEVANLAGLCHLNITSVFCSSEEKQECSIFMELMDKDLFTLMRQRLKVNNRPFNIWEEVDMMHQIAEGGKYLHEQGIVHRDLKSHNILVKSVKTPYSDLEYIQAKVTDFNVSQIKKNTTTNSEQTMNVGSNRWMAPELIKLKSKGNEVNVGTSNQSKKKHPHKCDIYSFAMVCYEIVTGEEPFGDIDDFKEMKAMVLKGDRPKLPAECHFQLKALIEKCWDPKPESRPTFDEICEELKYVKYVLLTGADFMEIDGLRSSKPIEEGITSLQRELNTYLEILVSCNKRVHKMHLLSINNAQCQYLVDKLNEVIESLNMFLKTSHGAFLGSYAPMELENYLLSIKLLLVLATQVERFIEGCSQDAWVPIAMTLTNVSEFVSSIGFHLELCQVALSKKCGASRGLSLDQVTNISKDVNKIVKTKASMDTKDLLEKISLALPSLHGDEKDLASYLLQRLLRVAPVPSIPLPESKWDLSRYLAFLGSISKKVKEGEFIGRGASTTVFKAMWLGMEVAVKAFYGKKNPDFKKEVDILAGLCHLNITSVFCYLQERQKCSIFMELMDKDLFTLMRQRLKVNNCPFNIWEEVDMMHQIAEGGKYLHEQGIVHRDLKSHNILVKSVKTPYSDLEYIQAKVTDFNVSQIKKNTTTNSEQPMNVGTNRWMAPEVIQLPYMGNQVNVPTSNQFEPKHPHKCDIYSFAMVCYEIVTGEEPFGDVDNPKKMKEMIKQGDRPKLPAECPFRLRVLIEKCWNPEPKSRPTFDEICEELKYVKYVLLTGANFMEIDDLRSSEPIEDHDALEMVVEPISQIRQALETIKHVCTMSSTVCVNKHQCKRIADRFSAIAEGLKSLGCDKDFNVGNDSDGSNHKDYPAFYELLTVLRKGETLVSSYIDSKAIISVVSRTENRESFKEIHEELDTLKVQFDFESFSELGQVKDFESSSKVERANTLAEDADQDLAEMWKNMGLIKDSKNMKGMDMEKATQVVLEKSGLWIPSNEILGPNDKLPSYLQIDPTAIKFNNPVRPVVLNSRKEMEDELGWIVVRLGKWIGCDFAVKVFKISAIDLTSWNNKQLLMEVGSLAHLRHPHIVRLVGFGQDAELCVFLMELMDADLRNFMKKKLETSPRPKPRPFKRPEELDIITQIAKGMHYMHTQQYAHGDLKCSNILVKKSDEYLEVKIADLQGSQKLGKVWDAEAFEQASQTRRPRWTAPEAINLYGGKEPPSELLKKSDVYSFGMTCYEVVTGKYPFDGIIGGKLLEQIHAGVRPELPGDLDEDLKGLIKQCWDHDPNKRPEFGEIIYLLNYIRSKKPVWNELSSKDIVLSLMKKIPQVHGIFTGSLGMARQGKEPAFDPSHKSRVWDVKGDGGFQGSDSALSIPEHLRIQPDKLEKVRRIGRGASATVYEATWLGCTFAVKVFGITTLLNIRALQQEVNFLINLSHHPCIAQMVGLSVGSNQRCSIVMEFMDSNLYDLIQSRMKKRTPVTTEEEEKGLQEGVVGPFELHEALPIISKIAWGMAFLHSQGVMHLDLKSTNVLAKEHARSIDVKLVDFSMSLHEIDSKAHGSYLGIGTGFWRAPELFPKKPDLKAVDVYSFAMTCYEVLTGKIPFPNLELTDYTPVIEGKRPALPAQLHLGLRALVQQCWHADPIQRPNFTEICEELQKIRQSLCS